MAMGEKSSSRGGTGPQSFEIEEKQAYRLESIWTDEETAQKLLEEHVDACLHREALKVTERRLEMDGGP